MRRTILVTVLAVLLLGSSVQPAQAAIKRIGHASARGDYATAMADGSVNDPTALWVEVKSWPHQKADGKWSVLCTKGSGAGTKSGDLSGTTPFRRPLKMSYSHPDSCTVSALAGLSGGSGRIKVILLARV